ncbi:ECF-type sigma factor [Planctomycetes bacterium K23_9]|uniref:RNA polymerase sigma factor SigL n=1 Tax=Stieleria marina TaxID=1930275 RepID=A0A517NZ09_9BACT|nr:RNA polymerase sigma factor SigL [Planctomycetes bacterium K23_9]
MTTTDSISLLVLASDQGDVDAKNHFFDNVYDELRRLAAELLAREKTEQTLHPSALVHEVYLHWFAYGRSDKRGLPAFGSEKQAFIDAAATVMRQILVDAARRKNRAKRGANFCRVMIDLDEISAPETKGQLLVLNESLSALQSLEPRIAEVVRLRFFAGMTLHEVADQMGIGRRTADGYWAYAKAWLMAEMSDTRLPAKNKAS